MESAFPVFSIACCNSVKMELLKRFNFLHSAAFPFSFSFFSPEYVLLERHKDFALNIFMHKRNGWSGPVFCTIKKKKNPNPSINFTNIKYWYSQLLQKNDIPAVHYCIFSNMALKKAENPPNISCPLEFLSLKIYKLVCIIRVNLRGLNFA